MASVEVVRRAEWIDPSLSRVTVGDWLTSWLPAQVQLKTTTRRRYEGIASKEILSAWARVRLCGVSSAEVGAWVTERFDSGLAVATVRYAHRVFSLALRHATARFGQAGGLDGSIR